MTSPSLEPVLDFAAPNLGEILDRAPGENFPVALRCLPRALRRDLLALYAFARLTDELGDEAPGDRLVHLDAWQEELDRAFRGTATHPVMRELERTLAARPLPRQPFLDLIEANRRDQRVERTGSWDELLDYCRLSANPVGRLVLALFDAATPERVSASDGICTALQVLEHCQDIREDWERGRIYLPADELAAVGVVPGDLGRRPAPAALRHVVAVQVGRAREGLAGAEGLVASLRGWARLAIAGFAAGGLAAADALEREGFDSSAGPPRPRRRDLLRYGAKLLVARGSR